MRDWQALTTLTAGGPFAVGHGTGAGSGREHSKMQPVLPCRTLLGLRWLAIGGQLVVIAFVFGWVRAPVPLVPVLAVIATAALVNILVALAHRRRPMLSEWETAAQLAFDLVALSAVLYMTGGLCNPFVLSLLVPVTIGAAVLGRRPMLMLLALALVLLLAISVDPWPLPWPDPEPFVLPDFILAGLWTALTSVMVVIAFFTNRATEAGRRRIAALDAAQTALERERRLADLGALAAAAAHHLATPLGTITLTLKELLAETPKDAPIREELELMMAQVDRCRQTLERLRTGDLGEDRHPFDKQPVGVLLREIARPYGERYGLDIRIEAAAQADAENMPEPRLLRRPEVMHGLTNFVENAVAFARSRVTLRAEWSTRGLTITITDDGPGFAPDILPRLGEPYLSGRGAKAGDSPGLGAGLGVFIACSLLARTGARVRFANSRGGGAQVSIFWPAGATALAPR